jgi:hypothetical protein
MKTIWFILPVLLLASWSSAQNNMLQNPGFEDGDAGWLHPEREAVPMATFVKAAARRGEVGLHINDQSLKFGSGVMSERIPVKPGQKVKVQFWALSKHEKFINVALVFFSSDKKWTTDVDEKMRSCLVRNTSGKWEKHQFDVPLIPDHVDSVAIWIHSWSNAIGEADFDDFELYIR